MFKTNYIKSLNKTTSIFNRLLIKLQKLVEKMNSDIQLKEELIAKSKSEINEISVTKTETLTMIENFSKLMSK